ncbi:MAG: histidinol-phosphate transaminase [Desulfomonile sp.]|nr:histidinol-phosphate transaminase [Desulfomonile sp.]
MSPQTPRWVQRVVPEHVLSIPPYVPGKPRAELEREFGIIDSVKMASNENPLGPSPRAVEAIGRYVRGLHVYPESSAPALRTALARRLGVSEQAVILGNGSDEIMLLAAHVFVRPGDEAVIGEHTFSMYRIVVEAFGGLVKSVPFKNHRFDVEALAAAVTPRTRLLFIANPNNPTGTVVSREEFEFLLESLPREGIVVVMDEAYGEYVRDGDVPRALNYVRAGVPLIVLRTFSKIYGLAGLRVGYGVSEPWLIELLNRVRPPFNVNSMAQIAAVAALEDEDHVRLSRLTNEAGMQYLEAELKRLGLEVIPSQANFITFCLERNAKPVYEALLRKGVIVRHLASFGMERYIRVTVGREAENRRFIGALEQIL